MASKGVNVGALETLPELLEIDEFYANIYTICKNKVPSIIEYCKLIGLSRAETIEAVEIVTRI